MTVRTAAQMKADFQGVDPQDYANNLVDSMMVDVYVRKYFVDNINGSASNDGLTWATAFAQISTAITAWEAWRAAQANVYARGAIYVRGTGTAYTALTALPSYCDIIGLGACAFGNGTGIVIIGANGADGIAGTGRGLGLYNLQFRAGGAFWCCDFVNLFRSIIQDCAFHSNVAAADGGIRFTGASGGLWIKNCKTKGDTDYVPKVGLQASGTHLNESLIEDCLLGGTTAGVLIDNTVKNGDQTVFRNNHIGDSGKGCTTALDDNQPADTVGWIEYDNNVIQGTANATIANNGAARLHGCYNQNGFLAVTAS
jgi:hypothetical protein